MGTRADFYVGRGTNAEWLGSIAYDGYPDGHPETLLEIADEAQYRAAVQAILDDVDSATKPEEGWPWPWDDSNTTDFAYAFDDGAVWQSCFGRPWRPATSIESDPDDDDGEEYGALPFPNMKGLSKPAPLGSKRSGVLMLSFGPTEDK